MNIMDKPTLQEVKEYFKNAKEVKYLENNEIFEIDFESINHYNNDGCSNVWCKSKYGIWCLLWSYSQKKYAEIISYKEPLYQLTAKEVVHAYENPQWLKDTFKECFETGLEVGKWYKNKSNKSCENLVFYKSDKKDCYGTSYYYKEWCNDMFFNRKYDWVLATEKEVEEALVKEAIKKGYKKGVEIKNHQGTFILDDLDCVFSNKYNDGIWTRQGSGVWIFLNGVWSEIITPTYTIPEAEEKFNIKIVDKNEN